MISPRNALEQTKANTKHPREKNDQRLVGLGKIYKGTSQWVRYVRKRIEQGKKE